jgi:hypothetical protein
MNTETALDFPRMDDEDTALAPSDAPTEHAYAWSLTETTDLDFPTERYSWRAAGMTAGMLVGVLSVVAAAVAVLGWTFTVEHSKPTPMVVEAAPVQASPPDVIVPTPTQAPAETPDQHFLDLMADSGWNMTIANPTQLITTAHRLCKRAETGQSEIGMTKDLKAGTPDITPEHAHALINNAETVYCPEYAASIGHALNGN